VRFDSLSASWDSQVTLKDISITVPKGCSLAIVGQTGSGKVRCLILFDTHQFLYSFSMEILGFYRARYFK
jgi:ABC-type multidrug transport system fused ATPase/permease subunit